MTDVDLYKPWNTHSTKEAHWFRYLLFDYANKVERIWRIEKGKKCKRSFVVIHSIPFKLAILPNSTCWSSIKLTAREKSLPAKDMVSTLARRLCFIFNIACETSAIEGRFLGDLCRHLCAILASPLTSSGLHSPTSFLSSISSTPSGLIAALKHIEIITGL